MSADSILFITALVAGFFGSILGIGGGIIVIPVLTLYFGIDIRYAIVASLISIIATSSGAAAGFMRDHLTNLRLAIFLELGTVAGAMVGFFLSRALNSSLLSLFFGFFLLFSALLQLKEPALLGETVVPHPWSVRLRFGSSYLNPEGKWINYEVTSAPLGLALMFLTGVLSAVLGIGGGILKVFVMDGMMKIPMKVSSATSNFMIGVTASASASAYFFQGDVQPRIVVPVAIGVLIGSFFGGRAMIKMKSSWIRGLFLLVLFVTSIQMIRKGWMG